MSAGMEPNGASHHGSAEYPSGVAGSNSRRSEQNMQSAAWAHHTDPGPDHHIWPRDDLIEHVTECDDECPCGPTTEPVPRPDGSMGWLVTHHSLDGRENRA